ncbi:hypothetical protein ALNOE001_01510 [Candidatus Methanobinarius endosymbioticus]|uniref:Uncharacterized protein n=1 Tax=Candidatus Methanobinarius endosymbioticus TaxID=2006182 RepID=A0A366ME03_9EURY|nr:hypothetical protein ALNOE001_01510 [Candidatus Methanobinarius endosymbioticus]
MGTNTISIKYFNNELNSLTYNCNESITSINMTNSSIRKVNGKQIPLAAYLSDFYENPLVNKTVLFFIKLILI